MLLALPAVPLLWGCIVMLVHSVLPLFSLTEMSSDDFQLTTTDGYSNQSVSEICVTVNPLAGSSYIQRAESSSVKLNPNRTFARSFESYVAHQSSRPTEEEIVVGVDPILEKNKGKDTNSKSIKGKPLGITSPQGHIQKRTMATKRTLAPRQKAPSAQSVGSLTALASTGMSPARLVSPQLISISSNRFTLPGTSNVAFIGSVSNSSALQFIGQQSVSSTTNLNTGTKFVQNPFEGGVMPATVTVTSNQSPRNVVGLPMIDNSPTVLNIGGKLVYPHYPVVVKVPENCANIVPPKLVTTRKQDRKTIQPRKSVGAVASSSQRAIQRPAESSSKVFVVASESSTTSTKSNHVAAGGSSRNVISNATSSLVNSSVFKHASPAKVLTAGLSAITTTQNNVSAATSGILIEPNSSPYVGHSGLQSHPVSKTVGGPSMMDHEPTKASQPEVPAEVCQSEISAEVSRGPLLNVTSSRASRRKKPYAKRLLPNETYKIYLPHNRGSDTGDTYDRFVGVFNERIFKSLQYLENVQKANSDLGDVSMTSLQFNQNGHDQENVEMDVLPASTTQAEPTAPVMPSAPATSTTPTVTTAPVEADNSTAPATTVQGQKQIWICLNCHVIGQTSICVKCKGSQIPYSMLSTGELQPIMSSNSDSQLLIIPITSSVSVHPPAPTLSQSSLPSPSASHFSLSSPASLQPSPLTSAIPPRQVKQIVLVQAPSSSMQPKVRVGARPGESLSVLSVPNILTPRVLATSTTLVRTNLLANHPGSRMIRKKVFKPIKPPAEPEVVQILSSDDEESKEKEMPLKTDADSAENQQPTSSAVPSTSNNSQSNDMPMQCTDSPSLSGSQPSADEQRLFTVYVRKILVGTHQMTNIQQCVFTLNSIQLKTVNESCGIDLTTCALKLTDILVIKMHYGPCGPVLFCHLKSDVAAQFLQHLRIDKKHFDPDCSDEGRRYIIVVPDKQNNLPETLVATEIKRMQDNCMCEVPFGFQIISGEIASAIIKASIAPRNQGPQVVPQITQTVLYVDPSGQVYQKQFLTAALLPRPHLSGLAQPVEGDEEDEAVDRSRSPSPVRSAFVGPIIKLFTYPPPPATGGISVTNEDFFCLRDGEFLNDVVIDFYLKYLLLEVMSKEDKDRTHLFSSFFYRRLMQKQAREAHDTSGLTPQQIRHLRVKTWTRHVDLFAKDFIIVPINESSHWYLAVICFPGLKTKVIEETGPTTATSDESQLEKNAGGDGQATSTLPNSVEGISAAAGSGESSNIDPKKTRILKQPCILVFDSLALPCRYGVVRALRDYLQDEWNAKKKLKEGERDFTKDNMPGAYPRCPLQTNYSDCGVYVLQYVESFYKDPILDYTLPIVSTGNWFTAEFISRKRESLRQLTLTLKKRFNPDLTYDPSQDASNPLTAANNPLPGLMSSSQGTEIKVNNVNVPDPTSSRKQEVAVEKPTVLCQSDSGEIVTILNDSGASACMDEGESIGNSSNCTPLIAGYGDSTGIGNGDEIGRVPNCSTSVQPGDGAGMGDGGEIGNSSNCNVLVLKPGDIVGEVNNDMDTSESCSKSDVISENKTENCNVASSHHQEVNNEFSAVPSDGVLNPSGSSREYLLDESICHRDSIADEGTTETNDEPICDAVASVDVITASHCDVDCKIVTALHELSIESQLTIGNDVSKCSAVENKSELNSKENELHSSDETADENEIVVDCNDVVTGVEDIAKSGESLIECRQSE